MQAKLPGTCLHTIHVLQAHSLPARDVVTHPDFCVTLWLPTACNHRLQTRTVNNYRNPVWNQSFHFRVHSQIKNMVELKVFDQDLLTSDEAMLSVLFDVGTLLPGEFWHQSFLLSLQARLHMGGHPRTDCAEQLTSNGVLVARELSRLHVRLEKARDQKESKGKVQLVVPGSYEGSQEATVGSDSFRFHFPTCWEQELSIHLQNAPQEQLKVPLRALPSDQLVRLVFPTSQLFGSEFFMGRLMKRMPESRICFLEDKEQVPVLKMEVPPSLAGRVRELFSGLLTWRLLAQATHNFLRGLQFHKDYFQHPHFSSWKDTKLDELPNQLTPGEPRLCLLDMGYFVNTSCPPLLQPTRYVDLILSLDYNLNAAFQLVGRMCQEQGIPFPPISPSLDEERQPRECHKFSDPGRPEAPVILHFPLVNDSFRDHSAPGVPRTPEEQEKVTYSQEDLDKLLGLAHYNICNNQEPLPAALREALRKRRQR
ncbi:cytosolic phospholipase A2 beta-like [Tenrec ecaudatus]|uniref:cytosolic phospholipase A2 beta-like n=1 Tax=Tenrec ecaudatus TaxID=94439 RepID=UPI003F599C94